MNESDINAGLYNKIENSIVDGSFLLTLGFDITGSEKTGCSFKKFIKNYKNINKKDIYRLDEYINEQKKYSHKQFIKKSTNNQNQDTLKKILELLPNDLLNYIKKEDLNEIVQYVQEYYVDGTKDYNEFDEMLIRLFTWKFRWKYYWFTEKGVENFIHIKLANLNSLPLYLLTPKTKSEIQDETNIKTIKTSYATFKQEPKTLEFTVKEFLVNIKIFLHLDLNNSKNSKKNKVNNIYEKEISRAGSITMLIEQARGSEKSNWSSKQFHQFITNTSSLCFNLNDPILKKALGYELFEDLREMLKFYKLQSNNPDTPDKEKSYVTVERVLTVLAWLMGSRIARYSKKNKISENKGYEFIHKVNSLFNLLSFKGKMLKLKHNIRLKYTEKIEGLELDYKKFLAKLLNENDIPDNFEGTIIVNHTIRNTRTLPNNEYMFKNQMACFSSDEEYPEETFAKKGDIDLYESGNRWELSCYIIFSDMLCTIAETLIRYNEDIGEHVRKKLKNKELLKITKKAFEDFADYYDIDIISDISFRDTIEIAKREMNIDNYYKALVERLHLFSDYEVAEKSNQLQRLLILLTIIVLIANLIIYIVTLYH